MRISLRKDLQALRLAALAEIDAEASAAHLIPLPGIVAERAATLHEAVRHTRGDASDADCLLLDAEARALGMTVQDAASVVMEAAISDARRMARIKFARRVGKMQVRDAQGPAQIDAAISRFRSALMEG